MMKTQTETKPTLNADSDIEIKKDEFYNKFTPAQLRLIKNLKAALNNHKVTA